MAKARVAQWIAAFVPVALVAAARLQAAGPTPPPVTKKAAALDAVALAARRPAPALSLSLPPSAVVDWAPKGTFDGSAIRGARIRVRFNRPVVPLAGAVACLALAARPVELIAEDDAERANALKRFEELYQNAKAAILATAVSSRLSVDFARVSLYASSATRHMVE